MDFRGVRRFLGCLPSTISVHLYLSARHYLEGAAWALGACLAALCLWNREDLPERWKRRLPAGIAVAAVLAMLCKETYAAIVPGFLLLEAIFRRRYRAAAGAALLAIAYAGYRSWMLGNGARYPVPPLPKGRMFEFLRILPYTLTSNPAGYLVCAGLVLCAAALLLLRREDPWEGIASFGVLLLVGIASIYPAAAAVLETFRTPGTWYRTLVVVHSVALLAAATLLAAVASRRWKMVACALFAAVLVPGTISARSWWMERFERSEAEARFYLANPDKLVYSEENAAWYLTGVDKLYGIRRSHFVSAGRRGEPTSRERARQFRTIWRFRAGRFVEDGALYREIRGAAGP